MASHVVGGKAAARSTPKNFYRVVRMDISVYTLPRAVIQSIKGYVCRQTEWYCRRALHLLCEKAGPPTLPAPQMMLCEGKISHQSLPLEGKVAANAVG